MRRMLFGRWARRDQRGVILVMAVPGLVLAMIATALSVDIGRQVFEKREIQKVADLAALDAVRDIANVQSAAEASAGRNGFDPAATGNSLLAERGSIDANRAFSVDPAGDSVRVTVSTVVDYIFRSGSREVTAKAVAQRPLPTPPTTTTPTTTVTTTTVPTGPVPVAGFTIGTTLASVDTSKSTLLNAVLGQWLKGAASAGGTADVVGWQGLATSKLTLGALRDRLELLDAGVQFGTVDQLLAADLTVAKLAQATANALNASGNSNASLYAGPAGIVAQATNTATFKLGQMIEVAAGAGDAALATEFNAFQLLTGSAMLANGTNLVSVPNIGVTLSGIGTTSLSLKVIEGLKTYIGPAGGSVSTGQVEMTITPTLNRPLSVGGLVGARLTGTFPLTVTAAGGTGTLSTITCSSPGGIRVAANLKPFSTSTSTNLTVSATVLFAQVPVATVATTGGLAAVDPTPENVDFAYAGEFTPTAAAKRVGTSPLGLQAASTYNAGVTALGVVGLPVDLSAVVAGDLKVVTGLLDTNVMKALHDTLGISIGTADVAALKQAYVSGCATPIPAVTTTTTSTTAAPTTTTSSTTPPAPKLVG